jgi:integrase
MAKKNLTDKHLKSLKPRACAYEVMDTDTRSFGVRVMPNGAKVHILYRRFPGSRKPTRRKLGVYMAAGSNTVDMSLADARILADTWNAQIRRGLDPSREAEREAQANIELERRRQAGTFENALKSYFVHKSNLRTIRAREVEMRRELKPWLDRPLQDITEDDVRSLVTAIKDRGAGGQARTILLYIKSFFAWCCDNGSFGLKAKDNPTSGIKVSALVSPTKEIDRMLSDAEIAAFWHGCDRLSYPTGSWLKLLLLSGLRRKEASELHWDEVKLDASRIIIDATRMKARPGTPPRPHLVPITDAIRELLISLPRFDGGFVFTVSGGKRPLSNYGAMKEDIDREMAKECTLKPWRFHDTRRTCRTKCSELGVPEHIGERILAHSQPELGRRYNLYGYEKEKREGLQKYHAALRKIVESEVVPFRAA